MSVHCNSNCVAQGERCNIILEDIMLTAGKCSLASSVSKEIPGSNHLQTLVDAAIFAIDMAKMAIDRPRKLSEGLS